jgi:hypothetical protein
LKLTRDICIKKGTVPGNTGTWERYNMGIKSFNNLPLQLKSFSDFKLFKSKLKTYLLQIAFYSLQEFLLCN